MLQVKFNRGNYNSYFVIDITRLGQLCYLLPSTVEIEAFRCAFRTSKDRYNVIKLSPRMFISWMNVLKGANHAIYIYLKHSLYE